MDDPEERIKYTARFEQVMGAAKAISFLHGHPYVSTEHLFLAILMEPADPVSVMLEGISDRREIIAAMREFMRSPEYVDGLKRPTIEDESPASDEPGLSPQ
ncbi:hypothetical protein OG592_41920 (plasmid) [Streptomyces avidinii]|uniref:Clp protease N-terminal domain-containing protein n=1 Tax=Streptomyces avidinii TaxID=1895 RepID=UPI002F91423D|nr:hypothetical protein OG592_41920 [Streptomyces avidinii]